MDKIIFVVSCMGTGGAQRVIANLANYFIKDYEVTIIMLFSSEVEYTLDEKVDILDYASPLRKKFLRPLWLLQKLHTFFKANSNLTIISFLTKVNLITILANYFTKHKLIISERNDPRNDKRGETIKRLCNILYPKADKVVFQTQYAKSNYNNMIQTKGVVIGNPIKIDLAEGGSHNRKNDKYNRLINVGRLIPQKNQMLLIEAMHHINKDFPNVRLDIFGEGYLRETLQRKIDTLSLNNIVQLRGKTDNIFKELNDSYAFILTSDFEGQSNAILEAMSIGLPSVSSNCSGINEIITNGENGLLFNIGDLGGLVEAIKVILSDNDLHNKISYNSRLKMRDFTIEKIAAEWKSLI